MLTYFDFLAIFLLPPILLLIANFYVKNRYTHADRAGNFSSAPWRLIALVSLIAIVYTTPWDNYLVVKRVWWYDPALVVGIGLGWVPPEEYFFFILQTILTGALTLPLIGTKLFSKDEGTTSAFTDGLAISSGTWVIDPEQSPRIYLGSLSLGQLSRDHYKS